MNRPLERELVTSIDGPVLFPTDSSGAMSRRAPGDGPVGHRDVPFSLTAVAPIAQRPVDEFLDRLAERVRPFATGGSFLNFLTDAGKTATAFTAADHARLAEIKHAWDPDSLFRLGHAIAPAEAVGRR